MTPAPRLASEAREDRGLPEWQAPIGRYRSAEDGQEERRVLGGPGAVRGEDAHTGSDVRTLPGGDLADDQAAEAPSRGLTDGGDRARRPRGPLAAKGPRLADSPSWPELMPLGQTDENPTMESNLAGFSTQERYAAATSALREARDIDTERHGLLEARRAGEPHGASGT